LDVLLRSGLIEPAGLVGDLTLRSPRGSLADTAQRVLRSARELTGSGRLAASLTPTLLALDWTGAQDDLLVGRYHACDVVLSDRSVSRRHARLTFRDGNWVLRDLDSTNGTLLNGEPVIRCRLLPGDLLTLGDESVLVD
jgi:FHA domain